MWHGKGNHMDNNNENQYGQQTTENPSNQNGVDQQTYGNTSYGDTSYGNTSYGNTNYGDTNYGNSGYDNAQYGQPAYGQVPGEKGTGTGMGIASLVLGILALVTSCCCINYILEILSIIFGIIQLVKNQQKGLAIAGIVCSGISLLVGIWFLVEMIIGMNDPAFQDQYELFYDEIYNEVYDEMYNQLEEGNADMDYEFGQEL